MRFLDKHVAVIVGDGVGRGLLFCVKEEEKERREKKRERRLGGRTEQGKGQGSRPDRSYQQHLRSLVEIELGCVPVASCNSPFIRSRKATKIKAMGVSMVFTSRFLIFQKRYKNSEKLYEWGNMYARGEGEGIDDTNGRLHVLV